jgi:uncharacterized protein YjdB
MRTTGPAAKAASFAFNVRCAATLSCVIALGCGGGGGGPSGPVPVANVSVTLSKTSLTVGETSHATASVTDSHGNALSGRTVTWSSSNTAFATVGGDGLVTSVSPGSATIIASSEGHSGSASLSIAAAPVASVVVFLPATIVVGTVAQANATVRDANGNPLFGRTVTWSSDNTAVATVSLGGLVSGIAGGTANITATCEGQTGSAPVTISVQTVASVSVSFATAPLGPGGRTQANATARDSDGNPVTGRPLSWASDNTLIATVSAQGVVSAVAPGTANIIATVDGTPGSAALTVAAAAGYGSSNQKIRIVDIGATFTPALTGSSSGATTFTSRATSVATTNAQGVITGVAEGQSWIVATAPGFAPDSIYVIVPRNTTGPVLFTDLTNYVATAGNTISVNVILDTRSTPIGGTEFSVGYSTNPVVFTNITVQAIGSPAPVVSIVQNGVYRVSLASGAPLTGQLTTIRFTFTAPITSGPELLVNRSGFFNLNLLDIVSPTGADLLPVSTSTRVPVIVQ